MIFRLVRHRAGEAALLVAIALFAIPAFAAPKTSEAVLSNGMTRHREGRPPRSGGRVDGLVPGGQHGRGQRDDRCGACSRAHDVQGHEGCPPRVSSRARSPPPAGATTRSPTATTPRTSSSCTSPSCHSVARLEADRMANLHADRRGVRQGDQGRDGGATAAHRRPAARAAVRAVDGDRLQAHPYRTPVVGWMNDLENMRRRTRATGTARWYAPEQRDPGGRRRREGAGSVRAGGAVLRPDPGATRCRPANRRTSPLSAVCGASRVKAPAELPYLLMAWHVPGLAGCRPGLGSVRAVTARALLDGNEAARLHARAGARVAGRRAARGPATTASTRGPSLFVLKATPSAGPDGAGDRGGAARADCRRSPRTA